MSSPTVPIPDAVVTDPETLFRRLNPYAVGALRQQSAAAQQLLQVAIEAGKVWVRFEVDAEDVWVWITVGGVDLLRVSGQEVRLGELVDEDTRARIWAAIEECGTELAASVPDDLSGLDDTPPAA